MKIFQYTNKGSREENQDFVIHGSLPDNSAVFVVADGMGGYSDGATASKVVSEAIYDFIEMSYLQYTPAEILKEAISFANDALMLKRMAMAAQKMGCVITVLFVTGGSAYLTWLGDSRITEMVRKFIELKTILSLMNLQRSRLYGHQVMRSIPLS